MITLTHIVAGIGQAVEGWDGSAVIKDDGATAIFRGRRYTRLDDYRFGITLKMRRFEWEFSTLGIIGASTDTNHGLHGYASMQGSHANIRVMGERATDEIGVSFGPPPTEQRDIETWGEVAKETLGQHMSCRLTYEKGTYEGAVGRWGLHVLMPEPLRLELIELAKRPGTLDLTLDISLDKVYVRQVNARGGPQSKIGYLLPLSHYKKYHCEARGYVWDLKAEGAKTLLPRSTWKKWSLTVWLLWGFLASQVGASVMVLGNPANAQFWENWRHSVRESFVIVALALLLFEVQRIRKAISDKDESR